MKEYVIDFSFMNVILKRISFDIVLGENVVILDILDIR